MIKLRVPIAALMMICANQAFAQSYPGPAFSTVNILPQNDTFGINAAQIGVADNGGASTGFRGFGFNYNIIYVDDRRADYGSSPFTYALKVWMDTGAAAARGSKIALDARIFRHLPDNTVTAVGDTIAANMVALSSSGDGGTNTGAGARGTLFGAGITSVADNGSTNLLEVTAAEIDVSIKTGASSSIRRGISVVDIGDLQAANDDYGISIGAAGSSPGFKVGLGFAAGGGPPVSAGGTLIRADGVHTVTNGVDFSNYTFTGSAFKSNGFSVNQTGVVTAFGATAIPAGGTAGLGYLATSTANFGIFFGSGAPTLSAAKGSMYMRSDGSSATTRAYVNTDGGTTWTAINTVL